MNSESCSLCGEKTVLLFNDGKDFFVNDGISHNFSIYCCKKCRLAFSFPSMDNEQLAGYYPDDFEAFVPKKSFAALLQEIKYKNDLKLLKKEANNHFNSVFEIGAGRGEFLAQMKHAGFSTEGIEPGRVGRNYAVNNYGIAIHEEFGDTYIFKKKYGIVIARHVLEHIEKFSTCLENVLNNGLLPGGTLFLKIPRLDSWEAKTFKKYWHGFDLPRHRIHFGKKGIKMLLMRMGFTSIIIRAEIVPTDIIRSISYYGKHGEKKLLKEMAMVFVRSPLPLQYILGQTVGILLSPFGAGRMIIFARKNSQEGC